MALIAGACSEPVHPLEQRCLEALAYLSPSHGEVEWVDRRPIPSGSSVTIRYEAEGLSLETSALHALCDYERGDLWTLRRMLLDGEEVAETELALVNSELLLRDLRRHPERFRGRRVAGGAVVSAPPATDPGAPALAEPAARALAE